MLNLFVFLVAPAAGGALLCKLWLTRGPRRIHTSLAVGQIPLSLRRRRHMAVRREVQA